MKNKEIELTIIACSFKNNFTLFTSPGSIIYIMLKKIILPVILLIFTQQELYGTEKHDEIKEVEKLDPPTKEDPWESINSWVNRNESGEKKYPKLWWLWTILDNITFQYGGSKIWKHGEAYYGLSNGIGFFPSFLNFEWLKIGIVDAHINVINLFLDYIKCFIQCETDKEGDDDEEFEILSLLFNPIKINLCFNIHIISAKILNCIKIKLIAPLTILFLTDKNYLSFVGSKKHRKAWYITYNKNDQISWWYALLSPRIELNIPEL